MSSGQGALVTKGGLCLPVTYQYVETSVYGRIGHLFCDASEVDPRIFAESMQLLCEDGLAIAVAVAQLSDNKLGFVGSSHSGRDDNQLH